MKQSGLRAGTIGRLTAKPPQHTLPAHVRTHCPTARALRALSLVHTQVSVLRLQLVYAERRTRAGAVRGATWARYRRAGAEVGGRLVTSVFFGGGAPSLFSPAAIGAVLEAARRHLDI